MKPKDFNHSLTRTHFLVSLEGTNNTIFYAASTAPIYDKKRPFPPWLQESAGLSEEIRTEYDYKKNSGVYERFMQFAVISLCSDIEAFFRDLFECMSLKKGNGAGFFQRLDDVLLSLKEQGWSFSGLEGSLDLLRMAFSARHIAIHNLGAVDERFNQQTKMNLPIGSMYDIDQGKFREMCDAYFDLLKYADSQISVNK